MQKNIVIFCDGTWNSSLDEEFGTPASTNVYRLYQACKNQAESNSEQFVWYQSGVGALGGKFKKSFDGATGTGVSANIKRGYMAIAGRYQPDDKIFLFGFSRGAFTARSIAGMIQQVGILENPTYEAVTIAYDRYRKNKAKSDDIEEVKGAGKALKADIHMIGIWDTVGALGFSMWGVSFNVRLFFNNAFHILSPNHITKNVYHALAMDEMRTTFMPTLWEMPASSTDRRPNVEQAWFRGVHSDVGGGYAERGLANISLRWMADKAEALGLQLRDNAFSALDPDPGSRIHRSYQGPLWTNMADWPRWFAPLITTPDHPEAAQRGYLHKSVFVRQSVAKEKGWNEPPLISLEPGGNIKVVIYADQAWNNTAVILEEDATYHFETEGCWQDADATPVGAEGQKPSTESFFKKMARPFRRAPKRRWMEIIGIVNYPREWKWSERSLREAVYYLLWADPKPILKDLFSIARQSTITVQPGRTGILWVFANDWWKTYGNNSGSVLLTITRAASND